MDKETKDYKEQQVDEADKIKDVLAEEQISKLDDEVHSKTRKNKKLKDKVKIRNVLIIVLIIIIIILLLRSCSSAPSMNVTPEIERQVFEIPEGYDEEEHIDGQVSIMGWNDGTKTISKSNPYLLLKNPSANVGYYHLQFTVKEGEQILYESKLLTAGNMLNPDFPKDMSIGEHDVIVSVTAYSVDDKAKPLCTSNIELKLVITE